jgi:osmotically-inducible protein OsmY
MKPTLLSCLLLVLALPALHGCLLVVAGGVVAGADVVHDRRGAGTIVEDRRIQLDILDAINRDKELIKGDYRVKVAVYNDVVLLCGQAPSAELRQRAQHVAEGEAGVKRVVNEIEITDDPIGFWRRRQDNAMSARVKAALLDITSMPGFDPTRVSITTSNHIVYLMGLVNHEEADASVEVVRGLAGVDKVVKVFEYTD